MILPLPDDLKSIQGTVMIVEDDEAQLELLRLVIQAENRHIRIITVHNGKEALEIIAKTMVDVIISDIYMPEIGGLKLCRKVKQTQRTSHIPVILISAISDENNRLAGIRAGADDFLTKPLNGVEIRYRVGAAIFSSKMRVHKETDKEPTENLKTNLQEICNTSEKLIHRTIDTMQPEDTTLLQQIYRKAAEALKTLN